MLHKSNSRFVFFAFLLFTVASVIFYAKQIRAQSNTNSLSGVYGCTLKDDRWGRSPQPGNKYDVSGLVFIVDMSNKKLSGIDIRYEFQNNNGQVGNIVRSQPRIYKDEPFILTPTELMNVFIMNSDGENIYMVATNGGNTLLLNAASSGSWVSESGVCQKM
jgi:hypothetical protein